MTTTDVKFSTRLATPPDWLAALRNNAVDALSAVEPIASQLVKQGLGVRLVSPSDVLPWYPSGYYVTSADYLRKNRPLAVGFLRAVVKAQQEIFKVGPVWAPELVKVMSEWSRMSPEDIKTIPTPPYYGKLATPDPARLAAEQEFWMLITTMGAIMNVEPVYRDVARNFNTGTKHLYTLVMLPAISPVLVDGMRLSVGLALLGTVTVEFLVGESGLGHLIWNSWTVLSLTQSMAGLIVAALLGSLAYGSLAVLEKILIPWR